MFLNGVQVTRNRFEVSPEIVGKHLSTGTELLFPVVDLASLVGKQVKLELDALAAPPKILLKKSKVEGSICGKGRRG